MALKLLNTTVTDLGSGKLSTLALNSIRVFGILKVYGSAVMTKDHMMWVLDVMGNCTRHEKTVNIEYLIRNGWIGRSKDGKTFFLRGKRWQVRKEGVAQIRMVINIDHHALEDRKTWKAYISALYLSLLVSRRAFNLEKRSKGFNRVRFPQFTFSRDQGVAKAKFTLDMISHNTGLGKSSSSRLRARAQSSEILPVKVEAKYRRLPAVVAEHYQKFGGACGGMMAMAYGFHPSRVLTFKVLDKTIYAYRMASDVEVALVPGKCTRIRGAAASGLPLTARKVRGEKDYRAKRGQLLREWYEGRNAEAIKARIALVA